MAKWTDTERHLLEQIYPDRGPDACLAVMPNRSRGSIIQAAFKMGLSDRHGEESATPVPAHDYTAPDYALRQYRYPVKRGQLMARIAA